jgi:hypothetical protein
MISAVETHGKLYIQPSPVQLRRDQILQIDSATRKKIYNVIAPYIRLRSMEGYQASERITGTKNKSRQLKSRGDDAIWRTLV